MQTAQYLDARTDPSQDEYAQIIAFARSCCPITYAEFDAATLSHVNLFAFREHFDFDALDETLDKIVQTLPAIGRIFAKPITHLKDSSEILPIEAVRVINNRTIVHTSSHSELWDKVTEEGLTPKKLLTVSYKDNYSIYENRVFTRAIDLILQFVGRNMRLLKDMLYVGRTMTFNLLERNDHALYYLAIGKLHTGYVRNYDKYRTAAEHCLEKLRFIDRMIRPRLGSTVYRKCKSFGGKLTLQKTNVFRNHKDYRRIYQLMKWFSDAGIGDLDGEESVVECSGEGYGLYCSMLALFAAGHFNFTFSADRPIDFYRMNADCTFKGWRLKLETVTCEGVSAIRMRFLKDSAYSIILLPSTDVKNGASALARFRAHCEADEYLLAAPSEEAGHICLSLYDIDSFRRLQQIMLRGMICSDSERIDCPFCGRALTHSREADDLCECAACRTQIMTLTCPESGERYYVTRIAQFSPPEEPFGAGTDELTYRRRLEAQMHYRNITKLGDRCAIVCPKCAKIH